MRISDWSSDVCSSDLVERFVDLVQGHVVGNEGVQRNLAALRLLHVARQLGTTLHAAERRTAPDASRDQLDRTGTDLLPRTSHADDGRFAPALVAALARRRHQLPIHDAFEGRINPTAAPTPTHPRER